MTFIDHDQIYPNPSQPRKHFDQGKLEELAQSIKMNGLLEPIILVKREDKYMIIAGERRWRACGLACVTKVPVRILEADEQKVAELSLLENLQREDLNVIEIATAYQGLLNMGLTEEEIAKKMGHKHVWIIKERLSLLNLQPVFMEYTVKGILSPAQALQMSRLPKSMQGLLYDKIASGKANTHEKLKALVNAILYAQEQSSFLPEPTKDERETFNKYDRLMERIVSMLRQSFNREDLSVLSKVLSSSASQNIDRIELIILHLNKIKKALTQSDSKREVLMDPRTTTAPTRLAVGVHLGSDLSTEWRMTKEYLDKKTTKEIHKIADQFGLFKDDKARAYLTETLGKKSDRFDLCKKGELVKIILESGVDLAGKVPDEILK